MKERSFYPAVDFPITAITGFSGVVKNALAEG
jgi:hypothetical protein